ncbi:MAG: metalloprotease TldD [Pseudomonadota bacterium]|nr:metalloprotease TldD [Pseudomonadota bacterium]
MQLSHYFSPLSADELHDALSILRQSSADYGDIYLQHQVVESWALDEGVVKHGTYSIEQGIGLRLIQGEQTSFACMDGFGAKPLMSAAKQCQHAFTQGDKNSNLSLKKSDLTQQLYLDDKADTGFNADDKVALLKTIEAKAKALDTKVALVNASLICVYEHVGVLQFDGCYQEEARPLIRLNITVVAQDEQGQRERGSSGAGGRYALSELVAATVVDGLVEEAVRLAVLNLGAKGSPAGVFPVVLGSGWPGVLLHEAVGHGLEADFNRKKTSIFADKLGQQVASELCTVVDDGTLRDRRGSLQMDDEGHPSQYNVLIENGKLTGYMQDYQNAALMNMAQTGNARRESYAHLPMPRMTNTYMLAGESQADDILASLDRGLYAVNFAGGQVDITSGQFTFTTSEAYWVENGKIQYPVKRATLTGNGPEVMQKISMVGNDLALDAGIGVCGKAGQSVPVGVGQPTLRVEQLIVGGSEL